MFDTGPYGRRLKNDEKPELTRNFYVVRFKGEVGGKKKTLYYHVPRYRSGYSYGSKASTETVDARIYYNYGDASGAMKRLQKQLNRKHARGIRTLDFDWVRYPQEFTVLEYTQKMCIVYVTNGPNQPIHRELVPEDTFKRVKTAKNHDYRRFTWFKTLRAAYNANVRDAEKDVADAKKKLTEAKGLLKKLKGKKNVRKQRTA